MKFRNLDRDSLLPETGFLRLRDVLKLIPVSPSSWWTGVRQGKFPKPLKLGPHTTVWRAEDIRALIDRMGRAA